VGLPKANQNVNAGKIEENLKASPFVRAQQTASKTAREHGIVQTVGPLRHYIALKYKTKFEVEGMGSYEIEVTNVVNTRTF